MQVETLVLGSFMANCYLLYDHRGGKSVVIDPGDELERIIETIKKNDLSVQQIILTHAHIDHVSAVADLKEATQAQVLMSHEDQVILDSLDGQANLFSLPMVKSFYVDRYLKDSDIIQADSISLRVLETPGHSPGSISLLGDGSVFVGDLLFSGSIGRYDLPGGSEKVLFESIWNKIMCLPDATGIYPGHGPATTVGEEKRTNPFLSRWV